MPTFHYALEANAGVNLILGLLAGLFNVQFLRQIGLGWVRFSVGGVYLLRGPLARRRSLVALFQGIPAIRRLHQAEAETPSAA